MKYIFISANKLFSADGKAARVGFREGDVITKINGKDVKWARHSDVVDLLQVDKLEIEIVTVQGVELAPQERVMFQVHA